MFETEAAIAEGAGEIDMVLDLGALFAGNFKQAEADVRAVVQTLDSGRDVLSRALAVQLEDLEEHFTGKLSPDERRTIVDVMERIRPHHS